MNERDGIMKRETERGGLRETSRGNIFNADCDAKLTFEVRTCVMIRSVS